MHMPLQISAMHVNNLFNLNHHVQTLQMRCLVLWEDEMASEMDWVLAKKHLVDDEEDGDGTSCSNSANDDEDEDGTPCSDREVAASADGSYHGDYDSGTHPHARMHACTPTRNTCTHT